MGEGGGRADWRADEGGEGVVVGADLPASW